MMDITSKKIGFIGAGNMAFSLVGGILSAGVQANKIWVSDKDEEKTSKFAKIFKVNAIQSNIELAKQVDIIVLAVKPQVLEFVCREIAEVIENIRPIIISIAAGIDTSAMNKWLQQQSALPIIRCMPNTPSLVQSGASGLYATAEVSEEQKKLAEMILQAVGISCWVEDEALIDVITALSGSGPAYFFLMMEAMANSAIKLGLDTEIAHQFAQQTALGAAKMALASDDDIVKLRQQVTSPGGTTEQAIASFEAANLRTIVFDAMQKANEKAKQLSKQLAGND